MQREFSKSDEKAFFSENFIHAFYCDLLSYAYHSHNYFEIMYVASGSATHTHDGNTHTVTVGDYLLMDYNCFHEYSALSDDFAVINCLFLSKAIDKTIPECSDFGDLLKSCQFRFKVIGETPTNRIFKDKDGKIGRLLLEMCEECGNKATGYLDYMKTLLIQTIVTLLRSTADIKANHYSTQVTEAVKIIEKHYNEHLLLSDIANKLFMSLPHLSIKFKEETGLCFNDYLKQIRIQNACRLLSTTGMKISDIAENVGYGDYKRFGAVFKELTGMSPIKYRAETK